MPWQRTQNLKKLSGEVPRKDGVTRISTLRGNLGTFTSDPNILKIYQTVKLEALWSHPNGFALQTSSFSGSGSQLIKLPGSFLYSVVGGQCTTLPTPRSLRARLQFVYPFLSLFISPFDFQGTCGGRREVEYTSFKEAMWLLLEKVTEF